MLVVGHENAEGDVDAIRHRARNRDSGAETDADRRMGLVRFRYGQFFLIRSPRPREGSRDNVETPSVKGEPLTFRERNDRLRGRRRGDDRDRVRIRRQRERYLGSFYLVDLGHEDSVGRPDKKAAFHRRWDDEHRLGF